ncbi:hypothetical protein ACFRCI_14135 [Streptomyces sp. NPDC056638]|uniref:hypothetical protein n=1 Tax=Streptomyces sp. NPDC056638 TaxID=3345887 RepID=UPI0036829C97
MTGDRAAAAQVQQVVKAGWARSHPASTGLARAQPGELNPGRRRWTIERIMA